VGAAENKALAQRFVDEAINKGDLSMVDSYTLDKVIDHQAQPGQPAGREGLKTWLKGFRAAFPDIHYTVQDAIAEGDKVVQRMTARGTMKGDFMGMPASGKTATWEEIHITRFANGMVAEHWGVVDQVAMLTQLGFMSQPAGVAAGR
jgi:steroid delta-isomerase-like uncharacterized protein